MSMVLDGIIKKISKIKIVLSDSGVIENSGQLLSIGRLTTALVFVVMDFVLILNSQKLLKLLLVLMQMPTMIC
jgi:hypothetical protein